MNAALAALVGVLITLMYGINSRFAGMAGNLTATLVIHATGLTTLALLSLAKRETARPARLPAWRYLGGFVGVGTVFASNVAYSALGASLAVAVGLLGQTLFALLIDSSGFLGRRKLALSLGRIPGIALAVVGVALMAGPIEAEIPALALALAAGALPVLSTLLNAELGRGQGMLRSVRINYLVGFLTVLPLFLLAGPPLPEAARRVAGAGPFLALGGGLTGILVVTGANLVFQRMSAFAASLLGFGGQALAGLAIDYLAEGAPDTGRLGGTALVLAGLAVDSLIARRARVVARRRGSPPRAAGKPRDYGLVLLDADGTLFDFAKAERIAFDESFALHGLEVPPGAFPAYERVNGGLWSALERGETTIARLKGERFRALFAELGIEGDPEAFGRTYIERLARGSFLLEGAEEACRRLHGRYTLAILTNGIREVQVPRIAASPIAGLISHVIVSEDAGCSKPAAGIFDHACRVTGFHDRSRMIIVGDSLASDIKGGIDYGIDSCWVNLAGRVNDSGLLPTYEIRSLGELAGIL